MKLKYNWGALALTCLCLLSLMNINLAENVEPPLLRHVVLFKFQADATPAQVKEVEDAFRALPGKIKEMHAFEYGTDNSPEGLAKGFTHCFLVTFKTEKDREVYLKHTAHQAFVAKLEPILDDVTVVDYWAKQ